ncbi:hypothetical protein B0T26DRAFT_292101 [Lasiosphaeria miniovina]|uniref:Uncharacterized protein n=1 Tax=Lasiosphaeria miniovina TaxID=1954250 RepID=A0AA40AK40_9PEZI|nr:uncharacterized protein B0T26DRAFT_292101 [Lasiosphaeria miniovina]KAK0717252.1 hypothetical protein B0T26DRAFT_292101 [Lasiosphaeria miniovina]
MFRTPSPVHASITRHEVHRSSATVANRRGIPQTLGFRKAGSWRQTYASQLEYQRAGSGRTQTRHGHGHGHEHGHGLWLSATPGGRLKQVVLCSSLAALALLTTLALLRPAAATHSAVLCCWPLSNSWHFEAGLRYAALCLRLECCVRAGTGEGRAGAGAGGGGKVGWIGWRCRESREIGLNGSKKKKANTPKASNTWDGATAYRIHGGGKPAGLGDWLLLQVLLRTAVGSFLCRRLLGSCAHRPPCSFLRCTTCRCPHACIDELPAGNGLASFLVGKGRYMYMQARTRSCLPSFTPVGSLKPVVASCLRAFVPTFLLPAAQHLANGSSLGDTRESFI